MQPTTSLLALNVALAGAREGFGPFLGVYLQQQGFAPASTGLAMGLAGLAGLAATTPVGALIDRVRAKRGLLAAAVGAIALGAVALVATKSLWLIALAQLVIGVADTSIAPLVAALTLGLVGQAAYGRQVSRNEAFNHAGNAANAALAGLLGYTCGLGFVAVAIVVMAVASCGVLLALDPSRIDHAAARGGERDGRSTLRVLLDTRPLLVLAGSVLAFQTANGAMLPFLAQARTAAGADPSLTTGIMTVTAQVTMIAAALGAARLAGAFSDEVDTGSSKKMRHDRKSGATPDRNAIGCGSRGRGHGQVLTMALALVVVRGGLAAFADSWFWIVPVQVLEGLAMGLAGVAIPALVAKIMDGTGHASAGLGGVMTAYGAGAALSPVLAGLAAQYLGFAAAFWILSGIAGLGLALWLLGRRSG